MGQVVENATREAQQGLSPAIKALRDMLTDDEAIQKKGSGVRVAAARSMLEYGLRLTEFSDVLDRIDDLEARQNEYGKH